MVLNLDLRSLLTFRAGEEGTKIWNLLTGALINTPTSASLRGSTTAVAWITRSDDADDGLAFGMEDGYLCLWKKNRNEEEVSVCMCLQAQQTDGI